MSDFYDKRYILYIICCISLITSIYFTQESNRRKRNDPLAVINTRQNELNKIIKQSEKIQLEIREAKKDILSLIKKRKPTHSSEIVENKVSAKAKRELTAPKKHQLKNQTKVPKSRRRRKKS